MDHANWTVTAEPNYWTLMGSEGSAEEQLLNEYEADLVARLGFGLGGDARPAIRLGNIVKKGLAIQMYPQIAKDWWERQADWQAQRMTKCA